MHSIEKLLTHGMATNRSLLLGEALTHDGRPVSILLGIGEDDSMFLKSTFEKAPTHS